MVTNWAFADSGRLVGLSAPHVSPRRPPDLTHITTSKVPVPIPCMRPRPGKTPKTSFPNACHETIYIMGERRQGSSLHEHSSLNTDH